MDEMKKQQYLDAISEIEDSEDESELSDEAIWLECFKAIVCCPKDFKGESVYKLADKALSEFKTRFRKDEESD